MINLLNAELYKLRKSTSYKVTALLIVGFSIVTYLFYALFQYGMVNGPEAATEAILKDLAQTSTLHILQQMFANSNASLFVTIFICLFAISDYSGGAVKNLVGKGSRREKLYLAKLLITEFGSVLLYLLTAMAVLIGGILYFGTEQLNGTFWNDYFSYLSMHILYLISYTAIVLMVCEITRNIAGGILISIFGVLLFSPVILQGIDLLLNTFSVPFAISKYWIITQINSCPVTDIPAQFVVRSGIVAVVWLIVSLAAGMWYHAWQDVK